jgi:hypothetical protein
MELGKMPAREKPGMRRGACNTVFMLADEAAVKHRAAVFAGAGSG